MSDARTDGTDDLDPDATGEGADLGPADPVTGVPGGDGNLNDEAVLDDDRDDEGDPLRRRAASMDTVTNDAVAGETVLPGSGDANTGPTGGAEAAFEPILPENDLAGQDIDLDDER
jgi:hypothetical protein